MECKPGQSPAQQQDKSVNSVQCADCGMQMNCFYVAFVSVPLTIGIHRMYSQTFFLSVHTWSCLCSLGSYLAHHQIIVVTVACVTALVTKLNGSCHQRILFAVRSHIADTCCHMIQFTVLPGNTPTLIVLQMLLAVYCIDRVHPILRKVDPYWCWQLCLVTFHWPDSWWRRTTVM